MMRTFAVLTALVGLLAVTPRLVAQDLPKVPIQVVQPNPQVVPGQPLIGGGLFPDRSGRLLSDAGLAKLELTKEQKAKFDKLNEDFLKKQKELQFPSIDVLKSPDPNKLKDYAEAQRKLRPDYLAKVEALLTDEQKKVFDEVRREAPAPVVQPFPNPPFGNPQPPIFGGFGPGKFLSRELQDRLKLTEEQRKKVEEMQKDLEANVLKVLTDDQKKVLDDLKKRGPGGIGFVPPVQFQPPAFQPPLPGGDPALQEQLKRLIRELEELRKEVKELKKGQK